MTEWRTHDERPGYLGKKRNETQQRWTMRYGEGNWRLIWRYGDAELDFLGVCAVYEDAYNRFFSDNPAVLKLLLSEASNVYDDDPSNMLSGFDYARQETERTHIQDTAIRRVVARMGERFRGPEPIQIRDKLAPHALSMLLSPGKVPFHRRYQIVDPRVTGWWEKDSVEDFYQSNKFLQTRAHAD